MSVERDEAPDPAVAAAAAAEDDTSDRASPPPPGSPIDLSRVPTEPDTGIEEAQRLLEARLQEHRQRLAAPAGDAAFLAAFPVHNNNSKTSFYIRDILDGSKFTGRRDYLDTSSPELSDTQSTGKPGYGGVTSRAVALVVVVKGRLVVYSSVVSPEKYGAYG